VYPAPPRSLSVAIPIQLPVGAAGAGPYAIITGPDGALWITLVHAGHIGRLETGGRLDIHELTSPTCRPAQIIAGPDGALWFTRTGDDRIGRITTGGQATSFPIAPGSAPFGLTVGPDEALWYTAMGTDRIGRITTGGDVTEFLLPTSGAMPSMITTGFDGALWFTLNRAHAIGRLSTTARPWSIGCPPLMPVRSGSPPPPTQSGLSRWAPAWSDASAPTVGSASSRFPTATPVPTPSSLPPTAAAGSANGGRAESRT
jgi:streptogramin lyase